MKKRCDKASKAKVSGESGTVQEAAMRVIGIIGGLSWESSAEYNRIVNEEVARRLSSLTTGRCRSGIRRGFTRWPRPNSCSAPEALRPTGRRPSLGSGRVVG